jgi:hypothetical protein
VGGIGVADGVGVDGIEVLVAEGDPFGVAVAVGDGVDGSEVAVAVGELVGDGNPVVGVDVLVGGTGVVVVAGPFWVNITSTQ